MEGTSAEVAGICLYTGTRARGRKVEFWDVLRIAVVGGIIGLDRLAFGQFMVSQPIVAAPVIGWMTGNFHAGLLIGVVLEVFWLRGLPVGGHVPKDATLAAVLTTAVVLLEAPSGGTIDSAWVAWVVLWVGALLFPAAYLNQWVRRKNAFLIRVAKSSYSLDRGVTRAVWIGLGIFFLYYFLIIFLGAGIFGPWIRSGYMLLPERVLQGLRLFLFFLPCVGIASLLYRQNLSRVWVLGTAGVLISWSVFKGIEPDGAALCVLILSAVAVVFWESRRAPHGG